MTPKEKAFYIFNILKNKHDCITWVENQICKKVHPFLNTLKLNQEQIDLYWQQVKHEIEQL